MKLGITFYLLVFQFTFLINAQEISSTEKWNYLEVGVLTPIIVDTRGNTTPQLGIGIFSKLRLPISNNSFLGLETGLSKIRLRKNDFKYQPGGILKFADFNINILTFGLSWDYCLGKRKLISFNTGLNADYVISSTFKGIDIYTSSNGVVNESFIKQNYHLRQYGLGTKIGIQYRIIIGQAQYIAIGCDFLYRISNYDLGSNYFNLSTISLKASYFI